MSAEKSIISQPSLIISLAFWLTACGSGEEPPTKTASIAEAPTGFVPADPQSSGDPAIRRSGDPAIRRSGDPAIRRSGSRVRYHY